MKGMAYTGWKYDIPEKFWPVVLYNFFDNPDEIRELGLRSVEPNVGHKSNDGRWPGYRSEDLNEIDAKLNQRIMTKILNCYWNLGHEQIFWNQCKMRFNLIPKLDKDKNNLKNRGWIHRDGIDPRNLHDPAMIHADPPMELSGLIYLTPDIEKDTGTTLFDVKKDVPLEHHDTTIEARIPLFKGEPISDEEIKNAWERQRTAFIEKVKFENIYNSLVMYDANEFHCATNYYTSKDNRLTLGFFIGGIRAHQWPLQRVRDNKI